MALSNDVKIREVIEQFSNEEREYRNIGLNIDGTAELLNLINEKGESGTTSITARTRNATSELGIKLRIINSEICMLKEGLEFKTSKVNEIGRFLTQKIVRTKCNREVLKLEVHGQTFRTLIEQIPDRHLHEENRCSVKICSGREGRLSTHSSQHSTMARQ
jgi:hypothetical protein